MVTEPNRAIESQSSRNMIFPNNSHKEFRENKFVSKHPRVKSAFGGVKQPPRNIKNICNRNFDDCSYKEAGILKNKLTHMTVLHKTKNKNHFIFESFTNQNQFNRENLIEFENQLINNFTQENVQNSEYSPVNFPMQRVVKTHTQSQHNLASNNFNSSKH